MNKTLQKRNYDAEMLEKFKKISQGTPLLLHSCCGPCSTSVLEQLAAHFRVTLLYYNPNIWPPEEYIRRKNEQIEVLEKIATIYPVYFEQAEYTPADFDACAVGMEAEPEGGKRCEACFKLRLERAAKETKQRNFEWFTTTLSVSPHKNATILNTVGEQMAEKYAVNFLPSDFKKREGYKRSLVLSQEYGLYRQDYCGCKFSCKQQQK